MLPSHVRELVELAFDPEVTVPRIETAIAKDPVLAMQVIWGGVALGAILLGVALAPTLLGAQGSGLNRYGNPSTLKPTPTSAAITPKDLQIRLYQFADDSMLGRQVGRVGNMKGTAYIAAEVKRLGLIPAGDNGTYFQVLPFHTKQFTNHSRLTANGNPLARRRWGRAAR